MVQGKWLSISSNGHGTRWPASAKSSWDPRDFVEFRYHRLACPVKSKHFFGHYGGTHLWRQIWRQTSKFDLGLQIGPWMTILSLSWGILTFFSACMVISDIPIDHIIPRGLFMTLLLGKISFKWNFLKKITTYALWYQSRDPNPSIKMHLKTYDQWKAMQLHISHPVHQKWLLKSNLTPNAKIGRLASTFDIIDASTHCHHLFNGIWILAFKGYFWKMRKKNIISVSPHWSCTVHANQWAILLLFFKLAAPCIFFVLGPRTSV